MSDWISFSRALREGAGQLAGLDLSPRRVERDTQHRLGFTVSVGVILLRCEDPVLALLVSRHGVHGLARLVPRNAVRREYPTAWRCSGHGRSLPDRAAPAPRPWPLATQARCRRKTRARVAAWAGQSGEVRAGSTVRRGHPTTRAWLRMRFGEGRAESGTPHCRARTSAAATNARAEDYDTASPRTTQPERAKRACRTSSKRGAGWSGATLRA